MSQNQINAYAAPEAGAALVPFTYDAGPLGDQEVEIAVESCGICHSDVSVINNEWGMTAYPVVPGHEVSGTVSAVGGWCDRIEARFESRAGMAFRVLRGVSGMPGRR